MKKMGISVIWLMWKFSSSTEGINGKGICECLNDSTEDTQYIL